VNTKHRIIILTEYGMNPNLYLYDSDLNLQAEITDVCELDLKNLEISNNAKRLLVVTECPAYDIKIVDLENGVPMNCERIPAPKD